MAFYLKVNRSTAINKTVRFPEEIIDKIEKIVKKKGSTFSEFVVQACEYAIDNLDPETSKELKIKVNTKQ